jgi:hypothetical protein
MCDIINNSSRISMTQKEHTSVINQKIERCFIRKIQIPIDNTL